MTSRLMNKQDACAYLGISAGVFDRVVRPHVAGIKLVVRVMYDVRDLDAWVDGMRDQAYAKVVPIRQKQQPALMPPNRDRAAIHKRLRELGVDIAPESA